MGKNRIDIFQKLSDWFLIAFAVVVVLSFIISPFIQYGAGWIMVLAIFFFFYKVAMWKK